MEHDPWADAPSSPIPPIFSSPQRGESSTTPSTSSPSKLRSSSVSYPSETAYNQEETSSAEDPAAEKGLGGLGIGDSDAKQHDDSSRHTEDRIAEPGPLEEFDDFDDFDEPTAGRSSGALAASPGADDGDDEGFGDFGEFEEGEIGDDGIISQDVVNEPEAMAEKLVRYFQFHEHTLNLHPYPSRSDLIQQLDMILGPLIPPSSGFTEEPIRQAVGISQILTAESSRDAYAQMTTPPMLKTLDWTRSRVRREHLISMGVPVNLDEVDSHRLTALPPLRINTANMPPPRKAYSLDPQANGSKGKQRDSSPSPSPSAPQPQSANPLTGVVESASTGKYGLGVKPPVDQEKVERLCGVEEDGLSIMSLTNLRKLQEELVETSASASALLAWLLQLKDAQTQDSTTYNGMISELISNAAKAKQSQSTNTGGGVFRRASQRRPQSMLGGSGSTTPKRVGSPAV